MTDTDLTGCTFGGFELRALLAPGGQGMVYRAYQPALEREVVVKILRTNGKPDLVTKERFLREAQLASRLDHPYAAHVYASGIDGGLLWIAMELVHGVTLRSWLESHGRRLLEQLVPFIERVAQVVHAAHRLGIVHRDLKPSNIMVIEQDGQLFPKLLDFGIAKAPPEIAAVWRSTLLNQDDPERARRARRRTLQIRGPLLDEPITNTGPDLDGPITRPGHGMGSEAYMAPEQWQHADKVGPAADIYSLGAILYCVITGERPFVAEHTQAYRELHFNAAPPQLGGELAPIDRVIQRALAKRARDRYETALDFAEDLKAAQRVCEREQLRAAALQWDDRARSPGLLWGREELADLKRWARREPGAFGPRESAFVAASLRNARREIWLRRAAALLAVAVAVVGLAGYSVIRNRTTEARAAEAELEQGRSTLLHGDPEALKHLRAAYAYDPAPSTAFMLARAMQLKLAELAKLPSTAGRTWSASFSPDGTRIVTSDDAAIQIWDAKTYRLLFKLPHGDTVYQALYSNDSTTIATACGDNTVRLWDSRTGMLVRSFQYSGKPLRYGAVTISGNRVAAIDVSGETTHVWDASTGVALAELHTDARYFYSIAFSANGQFLAAGGGEEVRIFDTRMWQNVQTIPGPGIHSLSWDPKAARLLTGSTSGASSLWDVPSGKQIHLREVGEPVDAVAFAPNGSQIATGSRDGSEQIWDAATGALQSQGNQLHDKIMSIEFDPASKLIVEAGANGSVAVADVAQSMELTMFESTRSAVLMAHFAPDSARLVGASGSSARIWNASSSYRRWTTSSTSSECDDITSNEPDRRFIAIGCQSKSTKIWDTDRGELIAELPSVTQVDGDFASAYPAISTLGDRAAIARNNSVEVYELPSGRLIRTIMHGAAVSAVAFGVGSHDLVSGAVNGALLVTRDNGAQTSIPASADGGVDTVALLADDRVLAAYTNRRMRIYDSRGNVLANLATRARVRMFRISDDGSRLVTIPGASRKTPSPELWDLHSYYPLGLLLPENDDVGRIYSARFSANREILATHSDGAVRRWDGTIGQLQQVYRGSSRLLVDATTSADGSLVIAGGWDGILRFWDADSGRLLWTLPAHRSAIVGVRVDGDEIVTRGLAGEILRWKVPKAAEIFAVCSRDEHCAIVAR